MPFDDMKLPPPHLPPEALRVTLEAAEDFVSEDGRWGVRTKLRGQDGTLYQHSFTLGMGPAGLPVTHGQELNERKAEKLLVMQHLVEKLGGAILASTKEGINFSYLCPRCAAADALPKDHKCAFRHDGTFTPDNFACATMEALWQFAGEDDAFHADDERIRCIFADLQAPGQDDRAPFGIITLCRYKRRGCIQGATIFNTSQGGTMPLTLAFAEAALRS